jgi:hypothetical protein
VVAPSGLDVAVVASSPEGRPVRVDCLLCGGPVEDLERNWIDPGGVRGRRFYLCNFHHQPVREGTAWLQLDGGRYVLRFKRSIPVIQVPVP